MTEPLVLVLPAPPSVNNLFATVGRKRVRTRRYKDWMASAWVSTLAQAGTPLPPMFAGRVDVEMMHERVSRRKDLDNLSKAPLDFLVTMAVIQDDSQVESITSRWSDSIKGMQITVRAV